jgi:hypothetical protein
MLIVHTDVSPAIIVAGGAFVTVRMGFGDWTTNVTVTEFEETLLSGSVLFAVTVRLYCPLTVVAPQITVVLSVLSAIPTGMVPDK